MYPECSPLRIDHLAFAGAFRTEWRPDMPPRTTGDDLSVATGSPRAGGGQQVHVNDIGAIPDGSDT